jgi:flagellar basal body-associated protein FliL
MMMMAKPVKPKSLKPKSDGSEGVEDVAPEGGASASKPVTSSNASSSESAAMNPVSLIILSVVMLVSSVVGPAATLYFLGPVVLPSIMAKVAPDAPAEAEGEEGAKTAEGGHGEGRGDAKTGAHGEGGHGEGNGDAKASAHGEGHGGEHAADLLGLNLGLDEFTVNLKKVEGIRGTQYLRAKMNLNVTVPEAENCNVEAPHDAPAEGGEGGHGGGGAPAVDTAKACQEAFQGKMSKYVPSFRDIINTALMKRSTLDIGTMEGQEALKDELIQEMNGLLASSSYKVLRVNFEEFIVQR